MRRPPGRKDCGSKSRPCYERDIHERRISGPPVGRSQQPLYNADILSRDVGIRFKGIEKTNVEEYCISEGWVRVTAGNAKDRYGNPLTIKVHGPVEPY